MTEIDVLRELGASEIIAEEFETSLEVLALSLRLFGTSIASIDRIVAGFRSNAYRALRVELPLTERQRLLSELVPEFDLTTYQLTESDSASSQTLLQLDLRARTGATLLAVRRNATIIAVPAADFRFQPHDFLVLAGSGPQIAEAVRIITGGGNS